MFEFLIVIIGVVLVTLIADPVISGIIFLLMLLLVLPGVYAMIFGAPFVASRKDKVDSIVKIGDFKKTDRVCELGCGDGRIIRRVADQGVKEAVGIEFSLPTWFFAKMKAKFSGNRAKILYRNLWKEDYSDKNVLISFLLIESMARFEKEMWPKLAKGTKLISNTFRMKNTKPDKELNGVYLYVKK